MRKSLRTLFCASLLLATLAPASHVAEASVAGGFAFSCVINLPIWPTSNGPAADCNGTATGFIQGNTTTSQAYRAVAPNEQLEWHWAKYSETCVFNRPLNGRADGVFSVSNMRLVPQGQADVSWNAVWTRDGSVLIGNLTGGVVSLSDGSVAVGQRGLLVAHMLNFGPGLFPVFLDDCTHFMPLTVRITGVVVMQA